VFNKSQEYYLSPDLSSRLELPPKGIFDKRRVGWIGPGIAWVCANGFWFSGRVGLALPFPGRSIEAQATEIKRETAGQALPYDNVQPA
jgi:hypothetical protein